MNGNQRLTATCEVHLHEYLRNIACLAGGVDPAAEVTGRIKSPESIRAKMRLRKLSAEQVTDRIGVRVIVSTESHCYRLAECLVSQFPTDPSRYDDYIRSPKRNGYRSLHLLLLDVGLLPVEVQLRTRSMHDLAEVGGAAHWRYKQESRR